MVAGGVGITLLPEIALPYEVVPNPDLVSIPFRAPIPFRTIGLAWRRKSSRGAAFVALAEALAAVR